MMSKTSFVLFTFAIALLLPARVNPFSSRTQSYTGVAWAQDADEADGSADVSTEPAVTPPDIAGDWSGSIVDDESGSTSFDIQVFQKKSKFKGDWTTGAGGSGTFVGKIKSNGVELSFKLKQKHSKCVVSAKGSISNPADVTANVAPVPEISGTYKAKKCEGATTGMFTLTENPM
jgi:hypothetical protein